MKGRRFRRRRTNKKRFRRRRGFKSRRFRGSKKTGWNGIVYNRCIMEGFATVDAGGVSATFEVHWGDAGTGVPPSDYYINQDTLFAAQKLQYAQWRILGLGVKIIPYSNQFGMASSPGGLFTVDSASFTN